MSQPPPPLIEQPTTPITFFEAVSNQGWNNGIANLVLVAGRFRPSGVGIDVTASIAVVADLRCTMEGLLALKASIEKVLLMAAPVDTKTAN